MPLAARQESPLTRMLLGGGEEGGGSRAEFKPQRPWRERLQFLLVSGVPVISLCSLEKVQAHRTCCQPQARLGQREQLGRGEASQKQTPPL